MEKPLSLSLLYTANLRGNIALLPQLYTFMRRLKSELQPGSLILDLGKACDDAAPHCRQTGGRSMLIVMDGMGYHAANVDGAFDATDRKRVVDQVTMALVDSAKDWHYRDALIEDTSIRLTVKPNAAPARLQICLAPAESTRLDGNILFLRDVQMGQVGTVSIDLDGSPRIAEHAIHDLPADTPPNSSIAGAIDFVESEARLFHKKHSKSAR